jgi:hypothetical protein
LKFADDLGLLVFEFKVEECNFDFEGFGSFVDNFVFFVSDLILDVIKINVRIEFSFGLVSDVFANGLDHELVSLEVASDIKEMDL